MAQWHPDVPDAIECRDRVERLRPRERQILEMLSGGWSIKQIARHFGVTSHTVHNSLYRAFDKLDARPLMPALALYHRASESPTYW